MKPTILIILGGGLNEKEEPNETTQLRYDTAVKVHQKYDFLLISSDRTYRPQGSQHLISEAEAGQRYLLKKGIPATKILLEEQSRDTFSNAYFCRLLFIDPMKIQQFTVLTSQFHLPKSKYVFSLVFPKSQYTVKFKRCPDPTANLSDLQNRYINERIVLQFYKKHLTTTYGIIPGDMETIHQFMENHNPAITGQRDQLHQQLTQKIHSHPKLKSKEMLF